MIRTATVALFLLAGASTLCAQYKSEPIASLPGGAPAAVAGILQKEGFKIVGPDGKIVCEIWFRSTPPPKGNTQGEGITMAGVAHGAFLGVIRFPEKGSDRRGQPINPGLYMLRLSFHPVNGDHQGVATQRDFLVLTNAATDTDPAATPDFDTLMPMSRKVSGTPHPAVLSMWKADIDYKPGFDKMGELDWVLQTKAGGIPIGVILVGKAEG